MSEGVGEQVAGFRELLSAVEAELGWVVGGRGGAGQGEAEQEGGYA